MTLVNNHICLKLSLFSCAFSAFPRPVKNYVHKYQYLETIFKN